MNKTSLSILKALTSEYVDAREVAELAGVNFDSVMSSLQGLKQDGLVKVEKKEGIQRELTDEGAEYAKKGLPERRLREAIAGKASIAEAVAKAKLSPKEKGIALQWAKKNKWLFMERDNGEIVLKASDAPESQIEKALKSIDSAKGKAFKELEARGLGRETTKKSFRACVTAKGAKVVKSARVIATQLTPDDLKAGAWRKKDYASYDLATLNTNYDYGKKHAYKEFLNEIKGKLVALGFKEARGPLVELEFWNMDALFMAQDHPAREIHDVFQIDDPARGEILNRETLARVRKAHEEGLAGSKGWGYKWDPEIAARLVMRSQTTAVSARELAKGVEVPGRVFCIGRVFRPDEIDWKHFIEFNQCEGIVADQGMTFRELLGYLRDFAMEVFGAERVKFAPSYFPFTEPSVEMFADIPGKGWAEVGGAGMFRPEMLEALGVEVPVLAWGLGIDRLAMIKLGATDIRDLFSHDLEFLRSR